MTARQQLVRLLPLALLVVLVMAGLRGVVFAPRWNGPLRGDGVAIGLAVEVVFGVLLVITLRREAAASRAARDRPYRDGDEEIAPAAALRFVLKWVLGGGMAAVAVVLLTNLHLHFFKPLPPTRPPAPPARPRHVPTGGGRAGPPFHIPIGPILYGLLVLALVAAVVISIWWSARLRRPASPGRIAGDVDAENLREAVESGRAALAGLDDARAAIIACYLAMERSLADRGAARGAADTPDELLTRAEAGRVVRGGPGAASRRLTALFYEARFSSHPLGSEQRDAARQALDELAAELTAKVPS